MKWLVCVMVLVAMVGCKKGSTEPEVKIYQAEYEATSNNPHLKISYTNESGDTLRLEGVRVWHKQMTVESGAYLYLYVRGYPYGVHGTVTTTIRIDGIIVADSVASGNLPEAMVDYWVPY